MIVVDASLAMKWLVVENDSDAAREFLRRYRSELAAPDLLLSEVSSALVRRANVRTISGLEADGDLARWSLLWREGPIAAHRLTATLVIAAGRMALRLGHPLADCLYLALAIELGCDLATCDAKFRDKAAAHYPRVRLLADFS